MSQQPARETYLFGQINLERTNQQQVIGVANMYINYETEEYSKYYTHPIGISQLIECESKNIKRLLLGSIVDLTLNELLDVLSRQNLLNINTLSIQKSGE
jgi:hypothetical protein